MSKPLLLLDITGVLCRKVEKGEATPDALQLNHYAVEPRPGVQEFLRVAYEEFEVGFFSSTTRTNADPILKLILTPEQYKATVLLWFRDRTRFDPEKKEGFETIKSLEDLFENPVFNRDRVWSQRSTLLVDDSKEKTRFNNTANVLIIESYNGDPNDRALGELLDRIRVQFIQLRE